MEGFDVSYLMKKYGCTKQTIHNKFKHPDIKSYINRQHDKLYLDPAGLNIFNELMSSSRVANRIILQKDTPNLIQEDGKKEIVYPEIYVKELIKQIDELKADKNKLQNSLDKALNSFSEYQKLLPAPPAKKKFNIFRPFS